MGGYGTLCMLLSNNHRFRIAERIPVSKTFLSSLKVTLLLLLALTALTGNGMLTASGQSAGELVSLGQPITDTFPVVRFFFEPFSANGTKLNEANVADLQVLEDGNSVPVFELNRYEPGLLISIAINVTHDLNLPVGDSTFFSGIKTTLYGWAKGQPPGRPDELTVTVNSGQVISRVQDPALWAQTIDEYHPDFEGSVSSLQSLITALDSAADTLPNPYMRRAILFITPKPTPEMQSALPNLTQRAAQLGVRTSVWVVSPGANPDETAIDELRDLTEQTGGNLFVFTDLNRIPDYDADLESLRYIFQAAYRSQVNTSGTHTVTAVLNNGEDRLTSGEMSYNIDLQPPAPIFLQPPSVIARKRVTEPADGLAVDDLTPSTATLKVVYEFPDGHQRAIAESTLYANGVAVVSNTTAPFDEFNWDLTSEEVTNEIGLQVKTRDELGLTGESQVATVIVEVEPKQQTWLADLTTEFGVVPVIAAAFGVVVLFILAGVLLVRHLRGVKAAPRSAGNDPLTQPVFIPQDGPAGSRIPASTDTKSKRALPRARLLKVSGDEENKVNQVFLLSKPIYTFGSNPEKATCVLDFPSVESLQARMVLQNDDTDLLTDQSKNSGTWVNYSPVPAIGTRLKDGDLVHFGKLIYRYEKIDQANELTIPIKAK